MQIDSSRICLDYKNLSYKFFRNDCKFKGKSENFYKIFKETYGETPLRDVVLKSIDERNLLGERLAKKGYNFIGLKANKEKFRWKDDIRAIIAKSIKGGIKSKCNRNLVKLEGLYILFDSLWNAEGTIVERYNKFVNLYHDTIKSK